MPSDLGVAGGYEKIDTITSSKGFTAAKILPVSGLFEGKSAVGVLVSVETADIRYTLDGTTPTVAAGTGAGHIALKDSSFEVVGSQNVKNFRCINNVGSSGSVIKCTYFF